MRIGQMASYIVKHYFSKGRCERRYGLLFLGPPGELQGKSLEARSRKEYGCRGSLIHNS